MCWGVCVCVSVAEWVSQNVESRPSSFGLIKLLLGEVSVLQNCFFLYHVSQKRGSGSPTIKNCDMQKRKNIRIEWSVNIRWQKPFHESLKSTTYSQACKYLDNDNFLNFEMIWNEAFQMIFKCRLSAWIQGYYINHLQQLQPFLCLVPHFKRLISNWTN